jgi:hypothetical protein
MRKRSGITVNTIIDFVRSVPVATVLQLVGFLFLVLNVWLATKLSPLAQNIDSVAVKVHAIEESLKGRPELIQRFVVAEQQVKDLRESIKEIKASQLRTEEKIDRLIERY